MAEPVPLVREDSLGNLQPWELVDDPLSPTGFADPTIDHGAHELLAELGLESTQQDVLAALAGIAAVIAARAAEVTQQLVLARLNDIFGAVDGLEISADNIDISNTTIGLSVDEVESILRQIRDNAITEDFAHEATLEAVRLLLTAPLAVTGPMTDTQLRASPPLVDIDPLSYLVDSVRSVDAAEDAALEWTTIDFSTSGPHVIVAVAAGTRLRLRRFLPTACSVPDVLGDPVLTLTLGGSSLRSQALIGRFDILGDDGEDLVITSSKAGQIDGSVGYIVEAV